MANRNNTEKSSIGPNQPHSWEVEHPTIDLKNTFDVPFDFISSQSLLRYPFDIPMQPTPDLSYTSSRDIPHQYSSSNEELWGVSYEEPFYIIAKIEVNQLHRHTWAYLKSLGQIPIIYQTPRSRSLKGEPNHMVMVRLLHPTLVIF